MYYSNGVIAPPCVLFIIARAFTKWRIRVFSSGRKSIWSVAILFALCDVIHKRPFGLVASPPALSGLLVSYTHTRAAQAAGSATRDANTTPQQGRKESELTDKVIASEITDKKETSRLVSELSRKFPLTSLQHLKRVKSTKGKLEIILCHVNDVNLSLGDKECISLANILVNHKGLAQPYVAEVPKWQPLTRRQFLDVSQYWPTSFHEDKRITRMINDDFFKDEERKNIHSFIQKALSLAKNSKNKKPNGAVIVDPSKGELLASSCDLSCDLDDPDYNHEHPLHHAVMVCIDLVAHGQGAGAYNLDFSNNKYVTSINPTKADENGGPYLCTGFDLYCASEPCTMCAMALVHSRIRRVFYTMSTTEGALGSMYSIHSKTGLNHKFEVFKVTNG